MGVVGPFARWTQLLFTWGFWSGLRPAFHDQPGADPAGNTGNTSGPMLGSVGGRIRRTHLFKPPQALRVLPGRGNSERFSTASSVKSQDRQFGPPAHHLPRPEAA